MKRVIQTQSLSGETETAIFTTGREKEDATLNAAAWPKGVTVYDRREAEEGGIFVEAPRFRAALTEEDIAAGMTFDVLDGIAKALRRKKGIE